MMKPNPMNMILMIMMMILITNILTSKSSIMCINLCMYATLMASAMSMKMKLTPIPFIVFLTLIGGLMIIFLYLTSTLWLKKEDITLKYSIMINSMLTLMIYPMTFSFSPIPSEMNIFNTGMSKITMMMIVVLTIMLIFIIEIHTKKNSPFRRKLKIWE